MSFIKANEEEYKEHPTFKDTQKALNLICECIELNGIRTNVLVSALVNLLGSTMCEFPEKSIDDICKGIRDVYTHHRGQQ